MPKSIIKEIEMPEITAGASKIVQYKNQNLSDSVINAYMPFLSVSVNNDSAEAIKVILNETSDNAYRIKANGTRALSGIPIRNLHIKNIGTGTISASDVQVTLLNDFEQMHLYESAKKKGYTI